MARNVRIQRHVHANDGASFIVGFGNYQGGDLFTWTPYEGEVFTDISLRGGNQGHYFDGRPLTWKKPDN